MSKTYENDTIAVTFDSEKCIHAAECVKGLSTVFDTKARPWINIDGDTNENIMNTIDKCPSGALSYVDKTKGE